MEHKIFFPYKLGPAGIIPVNSHLLLQAICSIYKMDVSSILTSEWEIH